ncbi:uncharacterized protein METZ01_LOCUS351473, partial [marine metagenome]
TSTSSIRLPARTGFPASPSRRNGQPRAAMALESI